MIYVIIITMLSTPIWGAYIAREADAYFEAKEYGKAIEYYEKLAQEPSLEPWQKAALQYNVAVSQIALREWDDALRTLQRIKTSSPNVYMHVEETKKYIHHHLKKQSIGKEEIVLAPETQIYIETAIHWFQKASRLPNEEPFITLEYAIEDQTHALSINRLYQELEKPSEELHSVIQNAQNHVLKTAQPFYRQVLEKEKKEYPQHCQCHPWDKVIPPFEEGYRRAKWLLPIIEVQEDILRYWKQTQENVTKQEEAPASIREVFSEIQQMDQDDQVPKSRGPVRTEGIKPW